jgi:hypothetical protein
MGCLGEAAGAGGRLLDGSCSTKQSFCSYFDMATPGGFLECVSKKLGL